MLIKRPFWQKLIEETWKERTIIWLMGVRRSGKTSLCQSLPDLKYYDCEEPSIRQVLADPEAFLDKHRGQKLILDEIHRLDNPSEILKIAADHYNDIKIIATGLSTLGANAKFRDTLTGRKYTIWLTPLLLEEMKLFGNDDISHRILNGGLPPYFIEKKFPEKEITEWLDAYWAKDIQDVFSVGRRAPFLKFASLLLVYSGGQFEASKYTVPCEVSRPTITNYLAILEETFVVHVIRPFSSHRATEIVAAPKVYGFDTGFVCHAKGWHSLRKEDMGLMWEHCILNELHAHFQNRRAIHYWRDKRGHEIDFVLPNRGANVVTAIECKYSCLQEDLGHSLVTNIGKNMEAFRQNYPQGENYVVANDIKIPYQRRYEGITLNFVNPKTLIKRLSEIIRI